MFFASSKIGFGIAIVLLCVFTWHAIDVGGHDHPHHEIFGEGVQAVLHGEDKKLLLISVLVALLFVVRNVRLEVAARQSLNTLARCTRLISHIEQDIVRTMLRLGIMQRRTYA